MLKPFQFVPLGLISIALAGCDVSLPVTLRPQETNNWCWAASGQMVMEYIDRQRAPTQCAQAGNRFLGGLPFGLGAAFCCSNPTLAACNNAGWPEFSRYGFSSVHTTDQALSWEALRSEILRNRPVAFTWHWNGGGGHMMVAVGFKNADERAGTPNMVAVHDPLPVNGGDRRFINYDDYVQGNDHTHWDDYYGIQRSE
jgi:hypothetical protein